MRFSFPTANAMKSTLYSIVPTSCEDQELYVCTVKDDVNLDTVLLPLLLKGKSLEPSSEPITMSLWLRIWWMIEYRFLLRCYKVVESKLLIADEIKNKEAIRIVRHSWRGVVP